MIATTEIFRWLLDTAAACTLMLLLATGVMLLLKQPARRLRVAELALLGCLLLALLQALPATRFSLGVIEVSKPVQLPWLDDHLSTTASSTAKPAAPAVA